MTNKLYILCVIPFSGKTTLAKGIVDKLGFTRIDLDEVKFQLFGNDITDPEIDEEGWNKVYKEMYRIIRQNLLEGKTIIHDTGNFTKRERSLVKKIADEVGVETTTIFVDIPPTEARKRLESNRLTKERFDVADEDFYSTIKELEIPGDGEIHLIYNWTDSADKWIEQNLR